MKRSLTLHEPKNDLSWVLLVVGFVCVNDQTFYL